jgi:hypothetical protein
MELTSILVRELKKAGDEIARLTEVGAASKWLFGQIASVIKYLISSDNVKPKFWILS